MMLWVDIGTGPQKHTVAKQKEQKARRGKKRSNKNIQCVCVVGMTLKDVLVAVILYACTHTRTHCGC